MTQRALVTGAGRGIGRAVAQRLSREGVQLVLSARTEAELQETASLLEGPSVIVPADLSKPEEALRLAREAETSLGGIDWIIANAGVAIAAPVHQLSLEAWQHTIAVNLTAPFALVHALAAGMIERKQGRIVFVSSISATRAGPNYSAYAASKAGLLGMTRSLAEELRPHNIQVTAISPGSVDTRMLREARPDLTADMSPEDIAHAIYFLLSGPPALTGGTLDIFG